MDLNSITEADLKKYNVAQLKSLCKTNHIVGFSKATKPVLIQKILNYAAQSRNNAGQNAFTPNAAAAISDQARTGEPFEPSSKPLSFVTNLTQDKPHIVASPTTKHLNIGAKRLAMESESITDSPLKKPRTDERLYVTSIDALSSVPQAPSSLPRVTEQSLPSENILSQSSGHVTVAAQTPQVEASAIASAYKSPKALNLAQARRKKTLEADPQAMNVRHSSVTCKDCGKVVKYNMFDLHHWNRHKARCNKNRAISDKDTFAFVAPIAPEILPPLRQESSTRTSSSEHSKRPLMLSASIESAVAVDKLKLAGIDEAATSNVTNSIKSLTAAEAQRKKTFEEDPLATNVEHCSVTCRDCGKVVKFTMFDLSLWNRHKARCEKQDAASFTKGKRFAPLIKAPNPSSSSSQSVVTAQKVTLPSAAHISDEGAGLIPHKSQRKASKASAPSSTGTAIPTSRLKESYGPIARKASSVRSITLEVNSESSSLSLYHLDFPMSIPITLDRISMPPGIAQRKYVARFAIILSQVEMQDLSQCMLVSRMFRYAIYLSASTRLERHYAGYRLNRIMHRLPMSMINMWPYLLQREGEAKYRRRIFEESFLGRVLKGRTLISSRLWTSPDNDKQIVIAIRFLMARLFFTISVGGGEHGSEWLNDMVVDAREIAKGEIWCIDVVQPSKSPSSVTESFYVLESTCEVVGTAPLPSKAEGPLQIQMRADWSAYVEQRTLAAPLGSGKQLDPSRSLSSIPATSLLDQLSWTNHEEYEKGISKAWLARIRVQQEVGEAKRMVAERYVLASVVENSVSGQYKTSTEMASDFAGLPSVPAGSSKKIPSKLNLFLPAHHHVESVHFTTANNRPLHPALAIVQTPAREYYILRDTGMQVGCEEEGVAEVWMKIIECAASGERT